MGTVLVFLGLLVEVLGIGLAMHGVVGLGVELFPGMAFPHRRAWRWVQRTILRKKPEHRQITVGDTAGLGLTAAEGRALITRSRPSDEAPLAEWNLYWESRIGNLGQQLDWAVEDMRAADTEIKKRLNEEAQERRTAVVRLEERLRVVVGGEGGSALVKTWWGLFAIGAGAVLQVAGGFLR